MLEIIFIPPFAVVFLLIMFITESRKQESYGTGCLTQQAGVLIDIQPLLDVILDDITMLIIILSNPY